MDKENLIPKRNPLERNMLRYLLMFDPLLNQMREKATKKGIKLFIRPFLIGFGLLQLTIEQIREMQDDLEVFH